MENPTKNGKKEIKTEGHVTSIVTSNPENIEKDPLSKNVYEIRQKIIHLKMSDLEKLTELLMQFKDTLDENCKRIKEVYESYGCPNILIEPAIGYFVPEIDKKDALLYGAEPSTIVTAQDLSEDGLHKFLLASGIVGKKYSQQAEILKFPISKEKFDTYVEEELNDNLDLIGMITKDQIIPTFEIIVNLDKLFELNPDIQLTDNYLENLPIYVNIITELTRKRYAASTWPTQHREFTTIYIQGWETGKRKFRKWNIDFGSIINRIREKNSRKLSGSARLGRKTSSSGQSEMEKSSGYRMRRRLILIPQTERNILANDDLVYDDLTADKKRKILVKKLLAII